MIMLPDSGSVLGIDIGFSPKNRSGAACCLSWTGETVDWRIERFRYEPTERLAMIRQVVAGNRLIAAALDGPLRGDLDVIDQFRLAESMLTRKLGKLIGKPGGSNSPVGIKLNIATNEAAHDVLSLQALEPARHHVAIHQLALVEAFPTSFLGLMLMDPSDIVLGRAGKSDRFFVSLVTDGTLHRLVRHLLPGRRMADPGKLTNHDDRAGFVCALTALAIAADDYTAVGDNNGWIILPPWDFIESRAQKCLLANMQERGGIGLYNSRQAARSTKQLEACP